MGDKNFQFFLFLHERLLRFTPRRRRVSTNFTWKEEEVFNFIFLLPGIIISIIKKDCNCTSASSLSTPFLLLKKEKKKCSGKSPTYSRYNLIVLHNIWCPLPKILRKMAFPYTAADKEYSLLRVTVLTTADVYAR